MESEEDEQLMDWLTRCDAIAGSDSYLQIGHPEDQVMVLKEHSCKLPRQG